MGYTKQAVSGFSWQSILLVCTIGITTLKLMVLARLLDQADFGIFSLVALILGFSEAITQTGINVTILQSKQSISYFLDTAWVIAIARGFLIAGVMIALGLGMGMWYEEPSLFYWVAYASLVPIIKGFINPAIVTFHKELQFFKDALYRLSLIIVESVAIILIALWAPSVGSFIAGMCIAALYEVVLSFMLFKMRPRFSFIRSRAEHIFSHAKGLSVASALSYIADSLDTFLVGKLLGVAPLGSYQNAYALTHKPTYGIAQALNHSTLPVFSRLNQNIPRLRKAFGKTIGALIGLLTVIALPVFIAPELIVQVVFGEKWLEVAPLLPWLIVAGGVHALYNITYNVLIALKRYSLLNWHRVGVLVLFVPLVVYASNQYGLVGAAAAVTIARLVMVPVLGVGIWKVLYS